MLEQPKLLIPLQNLGLRTRLQKAEFLLAAGQSGDAESLLTRVFEILELDSPGAPSLIKTYVLSRRVLARSYGIRNDSGLGQGQLEEAKLKLLAEVEKHLKYYNQLDTSYNIRSANIFLSVCHFTKGQVLAALGFQSAAKLTLERLFDEAANTEIKSKLYLEYKADLQLAIAGQLAGMGLPLESEKLDAISRSSKNAEPESAPLINYRAYLRYQDEIMICDVKDGCLIHSAADGSTSWINPRDPEDVKLLLQKPEAVMETDDPEVLKDINNPQYAPYNEFLIYQPWPSPRQDSGLRIFAPVTKDLTKFAGECISASPVKHLFLITGGLAPGALTGLIEGLNGHRLDTVGLAWFFSGEDITDEPEVVKEIGELCRECGNKKLLLLTPGWYEYVEKNLVKAFSGIASLRECRIFWTKSNGLHRPIQTKALDALLQKN